MKLQHLQTIKTFCQRMSGTWHHDMPQHSAEPITHQALAPSAPIRLPPKLISVTDAFVFSTSAKAWRQRQIKVGVLFGVLLEGLSGKTWLLKCSKKGHSTWKNNLHSASAYLLTTQLYQRWTMKLQHLQTIKLVTVKGCRGHYIMTCRSIREYSAEPTTHQALAPSAPIWFSPKSMVVTDAFIFSASAKAWRQRQIKAWSKNDISLRHVQSLWFKTWKNNPEIHGFIQHLHTESYNDETTAPANHPNFSLTEDFENMTS